MSRREYAARGGHLEVLQWAREHGHGCRWDTAVCEYAARGGHLEMLRWAREHDCPWNALVFEYAAWGGHLEVLKWLRVGSYTPPLYS